MSKESFDILNYIEKSNILSVLNRLGTKKLTSTGHGYCKDREIPIRQAAEESASSYSDKSKEKPAISLLMVVLSANRNYCKVVSPKIKEIENKCPELKSFVQLSEKLCTKSKEDFFAFWGHKDEKKYCTLKNLLIKIKELQKIYPAAKDDFDLMNHWGKNADLHNIKQDIIGDIPNIGIATFQHLRMVFGIDTVKPDQRVKEVLDVEFGLKRLSNKKAIKAVEQIASIAGDSVIIIDQILVKYGSSYYNKKKTS